MDLAKTVTRTLERFYTRGVYTDTLYRNKVGYSFNSKNHLQIHPQGNSKFSKIEEIIKKENPKKVIFTHLPPNNKKVDGIVNLKSLYNRAIQEICMKLPFPDLKNKLYKHLGMNIAEGVTVAPNVVLDYLNPQLISIGESSMIGEEAMILTHFLYPRKFEIGPVKIGKECTIGARAIICPGVSIGDYAIIGANAVAYKDVQNGAVIKAQQSGY